MAPEERAPSLLTRIRRVLLNREVAAYVLFGILTTLVNYAVYFLSRQIMPWAVANALAWLVAVEFAFLTNRSLVFRSHGHPLRQRLSFYLSRLTTLGIEYAVLTLLTVGVGLDDRISKLLAGVVVVTVNYLLSKQIVFRRRPSEETPEEKP